MRNKFSETLANLANKNKNIYIVVADISPAGKMETFQKNHSERFINVGVAEQTMIGVCAGLAASKKIPFAYTIATFSLYRPFEMVRDDLCYQNLPVTIVGMGAGTIYSTLGGTHLTQEDISIARSLPNMKILAPCDPNELEECIKYCVKNKKGPIYLRIGKSGEKNFTSKASEKWKFGKIRKIINGKNICILSYGPIIKKAFEIKNSIKKSNLHPSIYSFHTLKPIDENGLKKIFKKYKTIVTIEDHSLIGGLGGILQQYAYKNNYRKKIFSFGLKDKFMHVYGDQENLLNHHGIEVNKIINTILQNK